MNDLIQCRQCHEFKTDGLFRQLHGKRRDDLCKSCHADRNRDRCREYSREKRADPVRGAALLEWRRAYETHKYATDPDFADNRRMYATKTYWDTASDPERKDKKLQRLRRYRNENKHTINEHLKTRRFFLKHSKVTPACDLEAIEKLYKNKPEGMQVDHIIPLNGETVCGLHVLWNLQYLTKSQNAIKGRRFDSEAYDEWLASGCVGALIFTKPKSGL